MSSPRYQPRSFLITEELFGRNPSAEWRQPRPEVGGEERARLRASQIQHRVACGITGEYFASSPTKKITTLAARLDVPYARLQRWMSGFSVMQLEDLGRLYDLIGPTVDIWLLEPRNAEIALALRRVRAHQKAQATQRGVPQPPRQQRQ